MLRQESEAIAVAMGRIPSGCAILTAAHEGERTAALVSWFQQASFEPLTITVAVKSGRPIRDLMERSRRFVLNVLRRDDPAGYFKQFARGFGPDEDAFVGVTIHESEFGPVLPSAASCLGCSLVAIQTVGDHGLAIATVDAGYSEGLPEPYVHIRKSGTSY